MLFTSPQLQREFVKSHFKGSARKVRTDLDFGENAIFVKVLCLDSLQSFGTLFFQGHPYFEDWLSQVIMAALNIKTMKFSSNFSDSVEEPSEIMDNSRPNGVCATYYHFHYYHIVLAADNSRPNGVCTKYHHFRRCPEMGLTHCNVITL